MDITLLRSQESMIMDFDLHRQETPFQMQQSSLQMQETVEMANTNWQVSLADAIDSSAMKPLPTKRRELLKVPLKKQTKGKHQTVEVPEGTNIYVSPELIVKCEPISDNEMGTTSQSLFLQVGENGRIRMRKTKPREPAPCYFCQKVFCSYSNLRRHIQSTHSAGCVPLSCSVCNAVFNKEYKLRAHIRKEHDGDREFPCSECNLVFTRPCHLKVHMRIHNDERPFKCNFRGCGAMFRTASNLNRHETTHSGVRQYVCTVCGADFNQAAPLRTHIRTHTGERPFQCNKCEASFRQLTQLHKHRVKHASNRPYVCSQCGLRFMEKCNLTCHITMKHKKNSAAALIANVKHTKSSPRVKGRKSAAKLKGNTKARQA